MNRIITVKGTGNVSLKPDQTVVTMTLKSLNKDYDKSMQNSTELYQNLQQALVQIGFEEQDLKTTRFNVCTEHKSIRDKDGNYKSIFVGYSCIHGLSLKFDFDTQLLSKVLSAISRCVADPELSIRFTVKDQNAVSRALLEDAAANAREKAEILTQASGVKLGQLLSIDYNWGELNIYSRTEYAMDAKCMAMGNSADMSIEPDDIELSDSASFVWEIC